VKSKTVGAGYVILNVIHGLVIYLLIFSKNVPIDEAVWKHLCAATIL
jgi:hypothetical protein